jgi:succinate dehydrogenase / fumarate reductase, cytochrome b subunit
MVDTLLIIQEVADMPFIKSTVGRKILMAVTGIMLFCFVLIHLGGNSTIFLGLINAYGEHLHALPAFVWAFRAVMFTVFVIHVYFGIVLTLENNAARPQAYKVKKSLRATFAGKNMIWTGVLIAIFLVYHILHFTLNITNPELGAGAAGNVDNLGRPDVFKMIVFSFKQVPISAIYIASMIVLALHLSHGVQSIFQTLGLNSDKSLPFLEKASTLLSVVIFICYISIPIVILIGILNYKLLG